MVPCARRIFQKRTRTNMKNMISGYNFSEDFSVVLNECGRQAVEFKIRAKSKSGNISSSSKRMPKTSMSLNGKIMSK